jgi:predicted ATPase
MLRLSSKIYSNLKFSICKSILLQISEDDDKIVEILKIRLSDEIGAFISSLIPEISIYIGEQIGPSVLQRVEENQERLFKTFTTFFECFTDFKKLVLVIDDLQWADAASLKLLEHLLSLKESKIFILGTYRDNEMDSNHPLIHMIQQDPNIKMIHLEPLDLQHLNEMISETLELSEQQVYELGDLIHKKTLGNPFFSRELFYSLYVDKMIFFENHKWNWDIQKFNNMNFSSNVIEFMIKNLKKTSKEMQKVLMVASCLGDTFSIEELSLAWNDEKDLNLILLEPTQEGWIVQINSHEYKFFHDRLQQASYELLEPEEKKNLHFVIGTGLLKQFKKKDTIQENIYKLVSHLNVSPDLFDNQNELIQMNIIAAEQCLRNSAFKSAFDFSTFAMNLLKEDHWKSNYDQSFLIYSVHANTCYSVSDLKNAEITFEKLLEMSNNRTQKLKTYIQYMKMASLTLQFDKGLKLLFEVFEMFEVTEKVPIIHNDFGSLLNFTFELKQKIDEKITEIGGVALIYEKLPTCEDEEMKLFLQIIASAGDVIFTSQNASPLLSPCATLISVHLYLTNGLTDNAPAGFSIASWIYSFFFKDPKGYQFSLLTEKLMLKNKTNPPYNIAYVELALGFSNIFGGTLKSALFHYDESAKFSLSHGEFIFGAYAMNHYGITNVINGFHLPTLLTKVKTYQKVKNETIYLN